MKRSITAVRLAAATLLLLPSLASAQNLYTWTGTEQTMSTRLYRDGSNSTAGSLKAFPGTVGLGTYSFTFFTFQNTSGSTQTFNAQILGQTGENLPHFSLYLGTFNPANVSENYLGDGGVSCFGTPCVGNTSLGVDIGAGSTVVLVAATADRAAVAGDTFTWTGPDARYFESSVVPEPTTNLLVASGLVSLALVARRRRKLQHG